jgi:hypothetical protein
MRILPDALGAWGPVAGPSGRILAALIALGVVVTLGPAAGGDDPRRKAAVRVDALWADVQVISPIITNTAVGIVAAMVAIGARPGVQVQAASACWPSWQCRSSITCLLSVEGGMAFGKGHHLHLVDGSAFIFRAYHALPPLTRKSDGLPIGAVSGFCNMLWNQIIKDHGADAPTHAAVVFDKGSHTFRNDLYDLYKANRDEMPEDLRPQIPLTRDATRAFNLACLELEGYEADDIIATLAARRGRRGGA